MANNCKQCFNTHYQPHCHPTTKSLWLCSSVYCGPPHPSRRIMVGGRSRRPKIQAWFTQRDTTKQVLTHPSLDRKATISQTTFPNEFTWMKSFILWFNVYWCLFLRAQLTNKSALVDNKSMLVQAMDLRRVGDKPLPDTVHCRIEGVGMSWRGLTRINICPVAKWDFWP